MGLVSQPDMELAGPIEVRLFSGCYLEAQRSDIVALHLEGLRNVLAEASNVHNVHLTAIIDEIRAGSRNLRELADFSQVNQDRAPVVLNHLNIVLPCLSRSLRDITQYYDDTSRSKKNRWRTMYHSMMEEADGVTVSQRFSMYNHFLMSLRDLLIRSPNFNLNGLGSVCKTIMQLRENRAPPPAKVGPRMRAADLAFDTDPKVHWAQQIFSQPPPSRTALTNQFQSVATGPHQLWGRLWMPRGSKILFRRTFNDEKICLIAYEDAHDGSSYLLLRIINPDTGEAWFSRRGTHELCIDRDGCVLRLQRWSQSAHCSKLWAGLNFLTWEELALMYCTFLALKAYNHRTIEMSPEEYTPRGEKILFQARISDDDLLHSLIVYKDLSTGGIRLHAAVWGGVLRQCPVWTAFVTHQSSSPTWVNRVSRRRVRLADALIYVFYQEYRQHRQRRGQEAAFEINFLVEEACACFMELFPTIPKRSNQPQPLEK